MIIEVVNTFLNEPRYEFTAAQVVIIRKAVARLMSRVSNYREEKPTILQTMDQTRERLVNRWWRELQWHEFIATRVWRAMHGYFNAGVTCGHEVALSYGLAPADLAFMKAQLSLKDVSRILDSELDWRSRPLTASEVEEILREVRSYINYGSFKLSYIHEMDLAQVPGNKGDIHQNLTVRALQLIYHYEATRGQERAHLVNSVRRGILNYVRDEHDKYNANKRSGAGRTLRDTGEKDSCGNAIIERVNSSIREPLFLTNPGSSDQYENPALAKIASASVPDVEGTLAVSEVIAKIKARSPRVGNYLDYVVHEKTLQDLDSYVEETLPPQPVSDRITPEKRFDREAKVTREYFGVTSEDLQVAAAMVLPGLSLPSPKPKVVEEIESVVDVVEDVEDDSVFDAVVDVTPYIPIARHVYK